MAFRVSAAMALCFLFSLAVIARSVPLKEAGLTTNASSAAVTAAEVHAAPDGEGLLLLPYSDDDSVVPAAVETVVAEPDPDRSLPSSEVEGEEELVDNKLQAAQVEQGGEKTEEQIDDDEDDGDEEEQEKLKKKNKDKDKDKDKEKKKDKQKKKDKDKEKDKEKKKDKEKEKEKEKQKDKDKEKQKQKKKDKDKSKEKDKDKDKRKEKEKEKRKDKDENEQEEKKERWWRKKAISRSMFGHGRRSQREEAAKEEVKN